MQVPATNSEEKGDRGAGGCEEEEGVPVAGPSVRLDRFGGVDAAEAWAGLEAAALRS